MIRLVVVDDQPEFCGLIRDILSLDPEFEILGEAHDGSGAIELLESLSPQVLLLDVEMPDQNGLETAVIVKERFPDVTVVLMSAYHEREYREEALRTGAVDFIPKLEFSAQRFRQAYELGLDT